MEEEIVQSQTVPISNEVRYAIAILSHSGFTVKEIIDILEDFDGTSISVRSVYRISNQWKNEGTYTVKYHKNGNQISTQDDKQRVIKAFSSNPQLSIYQASISQEINPNNFSQEWIRNIISEAGLKAYVIPKVLPIQENHEDKRLQFCRQKKMWKQRWQDVLFSDECSIYAQLQGKKFVWLEYKEDISRDMCDESIRFPLKIMVWAIISYKEGPLYIEMIEGNMNSEAYIQVLENFISNYPDIFNNKTLFQQDNARCHISKQTMDWLEENQINCLDWPPYSPDLSPIENIWPLLKQQVWEQRKNIETKQQMFDEVSRFFFDSPKVFNSIQNAYQSLPKRVSLVIENNGGPIEY